MADLLIAETLYPFNTNPLLDQNNQVVIMQLKNFKFVQCLVSKVLLAIIIEFSFGFHLYDERNYYNTRAVFFTIMLQLLNSSNKDT